MRKLLKKKGWALTRVVTDKLGSCDVAFRTLGLRAEHTDDRRARNRAENSHQPVRGRELVPRPLTPDLPPELDRFSEYELANSCRGRHRDRQNDVLQALRDIGIPRLSDVIPEIH